MGNLIKFSRGVIALAMMSAIWLTTHAHEFEVDGIYYNILDETARTVEVTYKGTSYNDYYAYNGAVRIPSTVGLLGYRYSVIQIGLEAFRNCRFLTSVTIPTSVISIGSSAFDGCSGLTSVDIPTSVTSIGSDAFRDTGWYDNQEDGVIYLDKCCLGYKGDKPTGSLVLIDNTRIIANFAFYGCSGLTSATISTSVTSIGSFAFYGCSGLTSVDIPTSVISIGSDAFCDCSGLTSVTIPSSVTSIGSAAFYGCSGLTSVYFNATECTSTGGHMYPIFGACCNLTTLNIGDNVKCIPNYAFTRCGNIKLINSLSTTPPNISGFSFDDYSAALCVPQNSISAYKEHSEWGRFYNIGAGIDGVEADYDSSIKVARYDIHGRRLSYPVRGVNIIKMSDGTIRKEFVK